MICEFQIELSRKKSDITVLALLLVQQEKSSTHHLLAWMAERLWEPETVTHSSCLTRLSYLSLKLGPEHGQVASLPPWKRPCPAKPSGIQFSHLH